MTPASTDRATVVATTDPVSTNIDGEIWGRIEEPTTVTALVEPIAEEHDVARAPVRSDGESSLQDLHTAELIRVDGQPA